jgi:uncharacterized repeat protein (TIGR03803 family)
MMLVASASAAERPSPARSALKRPHLQILHAFSGGNDGSLPAAALILDATGALYGTTQSGGASNVGTAFKLAPSGSGYTESVLHAFKGGRHDGALPVAGLVEDASGALYGTTVEGGFAAANRGCFTIQYRGCGTVFELTRSGSSYKERILYAFRGNSSGDGVWPYAGLTIDTAGTLYGATMWGGNGVGNIFSLNRSGKGFSEANIYAFPFGSSGPVFPDGANPAADMLVDDAGVLYGTAEYGGTCAVQPVTGCGVVFKLVPSPSGYLETVLHVFHGGADGNWPLARLIVDQAGALYGTTEYGGVANDGTVFKLTPSSSGYGESILYSFKGGRDGALPVAGLIADDAGVMYGTTSAGGALDLGTIFKLAPLPSGSGYAETVLYAFHGSDGADPMAGLVADQSGTFYGTTQSGGAHGAGSVFALKQ